MFEAIAEKNILVEFEPAHLVAVEGVTMGCTEPPGPLGGGASDELGQEASAQAERAFYIGNLGIGAVGQIYPFEAGFGPGNLPQGGPLHEIEGGDPPTRPSTTARVAPFEGLLHPSATLERPPIPL
jgi:hypothetical protein